MINKRNYIDTDEVIDYIAKKKRFAKKDVKEILDGLIELYEDCAASGTIIKIRSFGKLHYIKIPPRKISGYTDKFGRYHEPRDLPEAIKVNFKLSENIRQLAQTFTKTENLPLDNDDEI